MNIKLIFSLSDASKDAIKQALDLISKSPFGRFEFPGDYLESDHLPVLRESFFNHHKQIHCIKKLVPASLTRNWVGSSLSIQSELKQLFLDKLSFAAANGVSHVELDLAFDTIREGEEIKQISDRASLLRDLLPIAVEKQISIALPIRAPKEFPKSLEWRLVTMLYNQLLHPNIRVVANVFPFEMNPTDLGAFFKKTFFAPSEVRFCFDAHEQGRLTRAYFQEWLQVLCDQGFTGDITLVSTFSETVTIDSSLKNLMPLLKPYNFD